MGSVTQYTNAGEAVLSGRAEHKDKQWHIRLETSNDGKRNIIDAWVDSPKDFIKKYLEGIK